GRPRRGRRRPPEGRRCRGRRRGGRPGPPRRRPGAGRGHAGPLRHPARAVRRRPRPHDPRSRRVSAAPLPTTFWVRDRAVFRPDSATRTRSTTPATAYRAGPASAGGEHAETLEGAPEVVEQLELTEVVAGHPPRLGRLPAQLGGR